MTSQSDQILGPSRGRPTASRVKWLAGLIVVATLLAYAGTMRVPLLLDDFYTVTENPSIRRLAALDQIVAPSAQTPTAGRPLANLSFAVSYALSGVTPWGYHLINGVIHALAGLALFGLVRRTLATPHLAGRFGAHADHLAGVIALLWVLHPVLTQSVTYISQRTESLMGLFYLLTLYCFVRASTGRPAVWGAFTVLACLLGTMCKEVIVTAPVVVLLYDRVFLAATFASALRRRWGVYVGLVATWLLLAWLMWDVRQRGVGFDAGVSAWHYGLTQARAVLIYGRLGVWPESLVFDYSPVLVRSVTEVWTHLLALSAVAATTIWAVWRHPRWAFLPICFLVLLAPTSSVVPVVGAPIAENRVYLPLVTIVAAGVLGAYVGLGARRTRNLAITLVVAVTALTVRRNFDYASGLRLWWDAVAKVPQNHRAHEHLACLFALQPGRQAEARRHFEESLRLYPAGSTAHNNFALFLAGDPAQVAEALSHYATALRLQPGDPKTHYNLALLLASLPGRQMDARFHYETALQHNPQLVEAHINLANLLSTMPDGRAAAGTHYEAALRLNPDSAQAHNNYGVLLAAEPGRRAEAILHYEAALRSDPNYLEAHNNLANLLGDIPERRAEAVAHYETCLRLNPGHAGAHNNLALLLAQFPDRHEAALVHFRAAAQLAPDYAVVHLNLARHLELLDLREESLTHYHRALQIDSGLVAAREGVTRLKGQP